MRILLFALCGLPLMAADLLPLATGNQWTYRASNGTTRTMTVGLPLAAAGQTYYRVSGYAVSPLWLRSDANGVYFYDDETASDRELLRFSGVTVNTPIAGCRQSAEADKTRTPYAGPAGRFAGALNVHYRPLACRDVGYEDDTYLENIGLVQRTETTIAGPVTYELVYAKLGAMTIEPGKKTTLSLSLEQPATILPGDVLALKATLRLQVADGGALRLHFNSSQRYDLAVRDANGEVVYLWSSTAIFLPVVGTEVIAGQRTWEIEVQVPGLLPGNYQVEAWLATRDARQLAVATPLSVSVN